MFKKNLQSNSIYVLSILFPILFFFVNFKGANNHGDYAFFKDIYYNNDFIYYYSHFVDKITGYYSDILFTIIIVFFSNLISYELFLLFINFALFWTFINLFKSLNNKFLAIIIFFSAHYLFTISLASPKNQLFLIFFFISFRCLSFKQFSLFYYLSFFCHGALSLIFYPVYLIINHKSLSLIFNIKKLIILLIPIICTFDLIYDKLYGYNLLEINKSYKTQTKTYETFKEFELIVKIKNNNYYQLLVKEYKFTVLSLPKSVKRYFLDINKVPDQYSLGNFTLTLNFSLAKTLKLLIFFFIIISLIEKQNIIFPFLYFLFFFFLIGMGIPRVFMVNYFLVIYLIGRKNYNFQQNQLKTYGIIIFLSYFLVKNLFFIKNFLITGYVY